MNNSITSTSGGSHLRIRSLSQNYGGFIALDDLSIDISRGEIICILGESGSGKTTLLRLLAGLEKPSNGEIWLDETRLSDARYFVEPEARDIGLVFQDYALFPHLTVRENVRFGLKRRQRSSQIQQVDNLLSLAGLKEEIDLYPEILSGGQMQRVALVRALAPQPSVLLMDEPFSGLDTSLRASIRQQTVEILRAAGITTIIVTHDPQEAMMIGDRIAVLQQGRLVQFDTTKKIYQEPAAPFVASFFSQLTVLPSRVSNGEAITPLGKFCANGAAEGSKIEIGLRPEMLSLADPDGVGATVSKCAYLGNRCSLTLHVNGVSGPVYAETVPDSNLKSGDQVNVTPIFSAALLFHPTGINQDK